MREKLHIKSSVRSRFALITAFILLTMLFSFYVGGRYVLIRMLRDVEREVQVASADVRHVVNEDFSTIRRLARVASKRLGEMRDEGNTVLSPENRSRLLLTPFGGELSLVFALDRTGYPRGGWWSQPGTVNFRRLDAGDLKEYMDVLPDFVKRADDQQNPAVGMMQLYNAPICVAVTPIDSEAAPEVGYLLVGRSFNRYRVMEMLSRKNGGMTIAVKENLQHHKAKSNAGGVSPVFTEVQNFYSGGTWHFGDNNFEAVMPLHDVRGNVVSTISIQIPQSFTSVAHVALGWLTVFITCVGIVFILPVFWLQARILLNPLTRLATMIQQLGEHHSSRNCTLLEWPTNDEFGIVVRSINKLLETLARNGLQMEQSEQRQRAILACIPDGLCIFDQRGRLIRIRKHPDGGNDLLDLLEGHTIDDAKFYTAESIATFKECLTKSFSHGHMEKLTMRGGKLENERVYDVRLKAMDSYFCLVVFRDITEEWLAHQERKMQASRAALQQRQESLSTLSAGIAHDINTVLTIILTTVENTWSQTKDGASATAVSTIRDAIARGARMSKDLMTCAGETHFEFQKQPPNQCLENAHQMFDGLLTKNTSLEMDLAADLPDVAIDSRQFWKIFINLVKNSVEAMVGRTGSIKIATCPYTFTRAEETNFFCTHDFIYGPGVLYTVSDTGSGIPKDVLEHIFEPFYSTKAENRGLGMATVLAIVDAHNGAIAIDSVMLKGTTFKIWIPLASNTAAPKITTSAVPTIASPEAPATEVASKDAGVAPFTCLLVDDDQAILTSSKIFLERVFHAKVFTASSKSEALATFRRNVNDIQVVFQDAYLGSVDTTRLVGPLRMCRSDIPIVIVSGLVQSRVETLFAGLEVQGYLAKPYTYADLAAMLKRIFPA